MPYAQLIKDDTYWIGTNDTRTRLFEHLYPIPNGVSYNSYLIKDMKTALLDTADASTAEQFLANLELALEGRNLDYLIVNHMEPDHSSVIERIAKLYPHVQIVGNVKTFTMMKQFFSFDVDAHAIVVKEGSELDLGRHKLAFAMAPMVHWPEAMVTYDTTSKILFAADAFGTFGAIEGHIFNDEYDIESWLGEYRRYFTNIVGKFGKAVQMLLAKAQSLDIEVICPLHGPIWRSNLDYIINKYNKWSRYEPEVHGVLVAYASIYGHTAEAARLMARELDKLGVKDIEVRDICERDTSEMVAESFRFSHIALFSPTFNLGIYPTVANYLHDLQALCLCNRKWVLVENGTWAPCANRNIKTLLATMNNMKVMGEFTITSALKPSQTEDIARLAKLLAEDLGYI